MDMNESFGQDKTLAESGKWFTLENGGSVRVAKLGSPKYRAEVQRLSKPHIALLRSSMDTSDLMDGITITAMSRAILLDWKDISLDGKQLPYSTKAAEDLMTRFPDFREVVSELSVERRNFMPEEVAEK